MTPSDFLPAPRRLGASLLVTAAALAAFAIGAIVPVPGLDPSAVGLRGAFGVSMARLSIFALGVTPLFSAMLLAEIAKSAIAPLDRYARGDEGRRRMEAVVFWLALVLTAIQAWGVALAYEGIDGLVASPGGMFRLLVVATFVAATALLHWLAGFISRQGVGEGFWLLFLAPSFAAAPGNVSAVRVMWRDGSLSEGALPSAALFAVLAIAALLYASREKDRALARPVQTAIADVWPPIIGAYAGGVILVFLALFLGADPVSRTDGPHHLALIAMMTLLVTALQNRETPRGVWALAFAQIFACAGGAFVNKRLGLPFAIDGVWLVIVVAGARSLLARWASRKD